MDKPFSVQWNEDEVLIAFYNGSKAVHLYVDVTNQDISWIGRFGGIKYEGGGKPVPWPDGLKDFIGRLYEEA